MGTIEEAGRLCLFLAAEATFTTGVDHILSGGAELAYVFDSADRHVVRVVGYAEKAVVPSEERIVNVVAKPDVQILSPQVGDALHFGVKQQFSAQVRGPVQDVLWTVRRKGEDQPLGEAARPVVASGAWQGGRFVAELFVITTPHRVRLVVDGDTATATWSTVPLTTPDLALHLRAPLMTRPDVA